jgi:vancomycin permeability regulator SanA
MACGPAIISRWWRICVTKRDAVEVGLDPAARSHRRCKQMRRGFNYIIVFGAAVGSDGTPSAVLRHRLGAAMKWAEGRSRVRFLVTGGLGDHPPAEADAMRSYLLERGVQDRMIMTEPTGLDTLSSAVRCIEILERRSDADSVVLCSSSFHLPRCWLIFRALGFAARTAEIQSDRGVLGPSRWLRASVREGPAIVWDVALALGRRLMSSHSSAVLGSIFVLISLTLSAGKPLISA